MTAKEYLSKIQTYRQNLDALELRIQELYSKADGLKAITYDKDRVQVTLDNQFEDMMVKLIAEADKWVALRVKCEREMRKRVERIQRLDNPTYIRLLTLRYIEDKRWEEIACIMNYTFRHVIRLHGAALADFARRNKDVL